MERAGTPWRKSNPRLGEPPCKIPFCEREKVPENAGIRKEAVFKGGPLVSFGVVAPRANAVDTASGADRVWWTCVLVVHLPGLVRSSDVMVVPGLVVAHGVAGHDGSD